MVTKTKNIFSIFKAPLIIVCLFSSFPLNAAKNIEYGLKIEGTFVIKSERTVNECIDDYTTRLRTAYEGINVTTIGGVPIATKTADLNTFLKPYFSGRSGVPCFNYDVKTGDVTRLENKSVPYKKGTLPISYSLVSHRLCFEGPSIFECSIPATYDGVNNSFRISESDFANVQAMVTSSTWPPVLRGYSETNFGQDSITFLFATAPGWLL